MFEKAVIRKQGHLKIGQGFDFGLIAETLIFYQDAHVLFEYGSLQFALKTIGADNLLSLVENKCIQAFFLPDQLGVSSNKHAWIPYYGFQKIRLSATEDGRKLDNEGVVKLAFERALGRSQLSEKLSTRFLAHVTFIDNHDLKAHPNGIIGMMEDDVLSPENTRAAAELVIGKSVPSYMFPETWHFKVEKTNRGFVALTNLNFNEINEKYHEIVPVSSNTISPAWILNAMLETNADMFFASDHNAELVTDPIRSELMQSRYTGIIKKREESCADIELFQQINLNNLHAIRDALNNGNATFSDFLKLLDNARKFKQWLQQETPSQQLMQEYIKACTSETWAEKLPTKSVRFTVFSGIGLALEALLPIGIGTMSALALSAADNFLLDKLVKGWKPNMFVEGPLKNFLEAKN